MVHSVQTNLVSEHDLKRVKQLAGRIALRHTVATITVNDDGVIIVDGGSGKTLRALADALDSEGYL